MKINFYYQYSALYSQATHLFAAEKLFETFKKEYKDIEFVKNDYRQTDNIFPIPDGKWCKFKHNCASYQCIIIENPANKKYFLITTMDSLNGLPAWDLENCVEIFPSVGVHSDNLSYKPSDIKYTPMSPPHYLLPFYDVCEKIYANKKERVKAERPFFMSLNPYLFRKYIVDTKDERFDMRIGWLPYEQFMDITSKYNTVIDINCVAEISNRTLDALGIGSALIRPKLTIKYHNELIPDYHYAALKCDDISNYKELADAYIERLNDLNKDDEFTNFISKNGRKWYEDNVVFDSYFNILHNLIDLTKLF